MKIQFKFIQTIHLTIFGVMVFSLVSCKKYLNTKPDKSLQIPSTVEDLQALLDHGSFLNGRGVSFDEASADDYYLPTTSYNSLSPENRNAYTWANTNYSTYPNDWAYVYDIVNVANIVLDNIDNIEKNIQNEVKWNNAKGSALFYRAFALMQGAFIFCKAYDESTAQQDLGMVLRLTSDFNLPSERASVKETYNRIITDCKESIPLLPDLPPHVMRPSKAAAYALLARIYLSMRNYDSCFEYADLALQLKSSLLDYNTVNPGRSRPFFRFNEDVIFHYIIIQANYFNSNPFYARVDSILYSTYVDDDIRKAAFFRSEPEGVSFKGSYSNSSSETFCGLASDEVYLMRAECYARRGDKTNAINDLNTLLITRWKSGTFVPRSAIDADDALNQILLERRKELLFRNIRWMDIKRLNKEGRNIAITRNLNGQTYTLSPNDKKYALSLPNDIIQMTGIPQNPF